MAFKVFLDANVILDQMLKRSEYDSTRQLFQLVVAGQVLAFTSPSIIHIVGYWLTKAYGVNDARKMLLTLLNDVYVLEMGHEITLQALQGEAKDIEDALQYQTAFSHRMDYFVSIDKKLKSMGTSTLPVITPVELIERFK